MSIVNGQKFDNVRTFDQQLDNEMKHLHSNDIKLASTLFLALATLALISTLSGCVSVSVGGPKSERSKGVKVSTPSEPFKSIDGARADGAWENPHTGNSISYLSVCNDPSDPSLESASQELFSDLKKLVVIKQIPTTFGGREALDSEVEGKVEGIATRVRAVVFKKNGCLYTLSLVGVASKFDEDRSRFTAFLEGFEAP